MQRIITARGGGPEQAEAALEQKLSAFASANQVSREALVLRDLRILESQGSFREVALVVIASTSDLGELP